MSHVMNDEMRECIEACTTCHAVCLKTTEHCLGKGGRHAAKDHIRLLQDCAQICQTSADFMLRLSPLHTQTCAVCAEVCGACGAECEGMSDNDLMQECAKACRACSELCHRMAGAHT